MYFKNILAALVVLATMVLSFSCDKNEEAEFGPDDKGSLILEFDNVVGSQNLQLNGPQTYTNANGDQFNVTLLNYYISNIKLKKSDGTVYTVPQDNSYFLVQESNVASREIKLSNIPVGDYAEVTFMVGVDSVRNTMDLSKRTGILDPAAHSGDDNMYWSWNSGYIFFKMEGLSPQATADAAGNKKFRYHIGGFGGLNSKTINNIKTVTRTFGGEVATVRSSITPQVHIIVDILKAFEGSSKVGIGTNTTVMFAPYSVNIANNYVGMFQVQHVHND
ncbi:MbnP family protein [Haliscomenobacter sp.]|uniref:MbnP family protein n=1 Tax=Haliscomenobacter sp. TaxID=2717303 RepID=UPI0035936CF5